MDTELDLVRNSLPLIREFGNGAWTTFSLVFAYMLARFAYEAWRDRANWRTGPWAFFAAVALCIWSIGSGLRAGGMWWLSITGQSSDPYSAIIIYVVSTLIGVSGLAACMAVFRRWHIWVPTSAACLLIPAVVHVINSHL